jgi:hypothetical protein
VAVDNSLMIVQAGIALPFACILGIALMAPTPAQFSRRIVADGSRFVLNSGSKDR